MNIDTQEEIYEIDYHGAETRMSDEYQLFQEYFEDWMSVDDPDSAMEFVSLLDTMTDAEYDSVAEAYVGRNTADEQPIAEESPETVPEQKGGGRAETAEDAAHDYFSLVDTLHDFNNIPYPGRTQKYTIPIDVILESLGNPSRPVGMENIDDSRCPVRFSDKITTLKDLVFDVGTIPNPLFDKKLESIVVPHTVEVKGKKTFAVTTQSYANVVARPFARTSYNRPITTVTVVCAYDGSKKVLELRQIADTCSAMKYKFGKTATFICDNSDEHLLKLLTATIFIDDAFRKKFVLSPRTDFVRQLRKRLGEVKWDVALCDANMIDAENGDFPVRPYPTGDVFRKGAVTQVNIQGLSKDGKSITVYVDDKPPITMMIPCTSGSRESVDAVRKERLSKNDHYIADKIAIKKAADWGQIAHCKTYSEREKKTFVFVTSDEMAAYWAMAQKVPMMNTTARAYSTKACKPAFCTLGFNMYREPGTVQVAGGRYEWSTAIVASFATIAMAVFASIR
jgi:hypothetical protein